MKWVQFLILALLIKFFLLIKSKSLDSFWIVNLFWPKKLYVDSHLEQPLSSTVNQNYAKLHNFQQSNSNFKNGFPSYPSWKKTGEVFCLKDCGYLTATHFPRSGLEMIREVVNNFSTRKIESTSLSSHLGYLIKQWKALLTLKAAVDTPWNISNRWGTAQTLIDSSILGLANILFSMRTALVTYADVGYKGTQLKMTLTLKGNQTVIFKPKRSMNAAVFSGDVYSGPDRHQGEIAAFHLSLILNLTTVPPVAGRRLALRTEVLPVASKSLSKTIFIRGKSTCFYGVCLYCRSEKAVCDEHGLLDGAAILWLPNHLHLTTFAHPWARTYVKGKLAKWETDKDFCHGVTSSLEAVGKVSFLLSLIDAAIFDFLIQNGDRHHYSVVSSGSDARVVLLDNGKSFGDPLVDQLDILAPLFQCCRLRRSTANRLELLIGGGLSRALDELTKTDVLYPILSSLHLKALDRRLSLVLAVIRVCHRSVGASMFV